MSSITASELLVGVLRGTPQARRARREVAVQAILERVPVLPFDLAAAQVHARLWAEMAAAGRIIGAHDFLIAATALSNGHDVLTQNVREFSQVPGLRVMRASWLGDA